MSPMSPHFARAVPSDDISMMESAESERFTVLLRYHAKRVNFALHYVYPGYVYGLWSHRNEAVLDLSREAVICDLNGPSICGAAGCARLHKTLRKAVSGNPRPGEIKTEEPSFENASSSDPSAPVRYPLYAGTDNLFLTRPVLSSTYVV